MKFQPTVLLATLGAVTGVLATPTHIIQKATAVKRSDAVDAIVSVIADIAGKVQALDDDILAYTGGDTSAIVSASSDLVATINSGTAIVAAGDAIPYLESINVVTPIQKLAGLVAQTVNDLVARKDDVVAAGAGGDTLHQLQDQLTAAEGLATVFKSKTPAELASIADSLSAQITDAIQVGIDAYQDQATSTTTTATTTTTSTSVITWDTPTSTPTSSGVSTPPPTTTPTGGETSTPCETPTTSTEATTPCETPTTTPTTTPCDTTTAETTTPCETTTAETTTPCDTTTAETTTPCDTTTAETTTPCDTTTAPTSEPTSEPSTGPTSDSTTTEPAAPTSTEPTGGSTGTEPAPTGTEPTGSETDSETPTEPSGPIFTGAGAVTRVGSSLAGVIVAGALVMAF